MIIRITRKGDKPTGVNEMRAAVAAARPRRAAMALATTFSLATTVLSAVAEEPESTFISRSPTVDQSRGSLQRRVDTFPRADQTRIREAFDAFTESNPGRWKITWDERTGLPRTLSGSESRDYGGTPRQAAEAFINDHRDLYGLSQPAFTLRHDESKQLSACSREAFVQQYKGLDVVRGRLLIFVTPTGRICRTATSVWPVREVDIEPTVDAAQAIKILPKEHPIGAVPVEPRLAVYPRGTGRLVYLVSYRWGETLLPWEYAIDAHTGELLEGREVLRHAHDSGREASNQPVRDDGEATNRPPRRIDRGPIHSGGVARGILPPDPCEREWETVGPPGEVRINKIGFPEDSYNKAEIEVGTSNFFSDEEDTQTEAVYGAGIALLPCIEYAITFSWDLSTWDSYSSSEGYWDVFFVTMNSTAFFWDLDLDGPLADLDCTSSSESVAPPAPTHVWAFGGGSFMDGTLCSKSGTHSFTFREPDHEKITYLSFGLDTGRSGAVDGLQPSWGTFTVTINGGTHIFNPNPVTTLVDPDLKDSGPGGMFPPDSNAAVPCPAYEEVDLPLLHTPDPGEPWKLEGPWVTIRDLAPPAGGNNLSITPPEMPFDEFPFLRDCDPFEAAMCYYHITKSQQHIQSLGFDGTTNTAINKRQIQVDPHGTKEWNAFYLPDDKGRGPLIFGDASMVSFDCDGDGNPDPARDYVDAAEDGDVILHEYAHAILDNQNTNAFEGPNGNRDASGTYFADETRAIDEGFADYWACSHFVEQNLDSGFDPAIFAEWFFVECPLYGRRVENTMKYPQSMSRNFARYHRDGQIWSAALWDLLKIFGKDTADTMALDGNFLVSPDPLFADAAEAVIHGDLHRTGGIRSPIAAGVFEDRGFLKTLTVKAEGLDPYIAVDTPDVFYAVGSPAEFKRVYKWGEVITLHAPASHGDQPFSRWRLDGTLQPIGKRDLSVTMKHPHTAIATYSGIGIDCGEVELIENLSDEIVDGLAVACGQDSITDENAFARSYDLSANPTTAGKSFLVRCVDIGIESNTGSQLVGNVNVYHDTDGGEPIAPGEDLELLGSTGLLLIGGSDARILTTAFDSPVVVPADSVMVVELVLPAHLDGGVWPGTNSAGEDGATYIRAADCEVPTYVPMAEIGFPDVHWVQHVNGTALSVGDIDGNGVIDVRDMVAIILAWGPCDGPCPADLNGDGIVDVQDIVLVILNWG